MACRKTALSLQKLNIEQPTAHVALLAAPGRNGLRGPHPVGWERARVVLKVIYNIT